MLTELGKVQAPLTQIGNVAPRGEGSGKGQRGVEGGMEEGGREGVEGGGEAGGT